MRAQLDAGAWAHWAAEATMAPVVHGVGNYRGARCRNCSNNIINVGTCPQAPVKRPAIIHPSPTAHPPTTHRTPTAEQQQQQSHTRIISNSNNTANTRGWWGMGWVGGWVGGRVVGGGWVVGGWVMAVG